jgi:hypothetical protein
MILEYNSIFMYDNTPIHKAYKIRDMFIELGINIMCSTSRDASAALNGSISCLDWTTELAGAKLAIYI